MAIYVDLDGTLAKQSKDFKGMEHIGAPVPEMMDRVKDWLAKGVTVVIFTARMNDKGAFPYIKRWLREQGIDHLRVTNVKGPDVDEIWDNRAVAVETNTGKVLGGKSKHDASWEDDARKAMK